MKSYRIADIPFSIEGPTLEEAIASTPGFSLFESASDAPCFRIRETESITLPSRDILYAVDVEDARLENGTCSDGRRWFSIATDAGELTFTADILSGEVSVAGVFRPDMLKSALWNAYGMMTAAAGRVAVHSSCVTLGDKAYLFLGESGTGKSTHSRLWLECIPGAQLLNDDSPVLSASSGGVYAFGSPWSGKTPCFRNQRVPLAGIVRLRQAPVNEISRLSGINALGALYPSFPPGLCSDPGIYSHLGKTMASILSKVPVFSLGCRPDHDAAFLCHSFMNAPES